MTGGVQTPGTPGYSTRSFYFHEIKITLESSLGNPLGTGVHQRDAGRVSTPALGVLFAVVRRPFLTASTQRARTVK